MNSLGTILLGCSVILLWVVALYTPVSKKESYSNGFTLKYHTMSTQTEPIVQEAPPFPSHSFETNQVKCEHGICIRDDPPVSGPVMPVSTPIEFDETPPPHVVEQVKGPTIMKAPRPDGRIERDWFELRPMDRVTLLDSNPFRL